MPQPFAEIEWIARTEDVQVRVNTLAARQGTPWHFHSAVEDHVFCIDEGIEVALADPEESVALRPGERWRVPLRRVHRVVNRADRPARYLLVQATGRYDFHEVTR